MDYLSVYGSLDGAERAPQRPDLTNGVAVEMPLVGLGSATGEDQPAAS
jgi:hypothetical protein